MEPGNRFIRSPRPSPVTVNLGCFYGWFQLPPLALSFTGQRKLQAGESLAKDLFFKAQEKLSEIGHFVMPDISKFGFPWTEAALVEEQKHPPTELKQPKRDQPMRLELQFLQYQSIWLPKA